jgi:hypothetical protein
MIVPYFRRCFDRGFAALHWIGIAQRTACNTWSPWCRLGNGEPVGRLGRVRNRFGNEEQKRAGDHQRGEDKSHLGHLGFEKPEAKRFPWSTQKTAGLNQRP